MKGAKRTARTYGPGTRSLVLVLLLGTVLGIAGTDLILPALPELLSRAGGDSRLVHLVVVSYVGGFAIGLVLFGELYHRYPVIIVARSAVLLFVVSSGVLSAVGSVEWMIAIRVIQGIAGASPAVAAPLVIRRIYGDQDASSMVSVFAGLEALVPAAAPVIGYSIVNKFGVSSIFVVLCLLGVVQMFLLIGAPATFSSSVPSSQRVGIGRYKSLLMRPQFLRYAVGHAVSLAAVLTMAFSSPLLFYVTLGGSVEDFILMQIVGILGFICAAAVVGRLSGDAVGHSSVRLGCAVMLVGASILLCVVILDVVSVRATIVAFVVMNVGLGIRVPKGFVAAIILSDDEPRASAVVLLVTMVLAGLGTYVSSSGSGVSPAALGVTVGGMIGLSAVLNLSRP